MNKMDLWQGNITISWYLQFFSLLFYGIIIIAILFAPWPAEHSYLWGLLLLVTIICAFLTQRRLIMTHGHLIIRHNHKLKLIFQSDEWYIEGRLFTLKGFIFLKLKSTTENKSRLMILAYDSMGKKSWYSLNRFLQFHSQIKQVLQ